VSSMSVILGKKSRRSITLCRRGVCWGSPMATYFEDLDTMNRQGEVWAFSGPSRLDRVARYLGSAARSLLAKGVADHELQHTARAPPGVGVMRCVSARQEHKTPPPLLPR
jgi:hypothetical protein